MSKPIVWMHNTGQQERILIVDRAKDGWTAVRQLTRGSSFGDDAAEWTEARIVLDTAIAEQIVSAMYRLTVKEATGRELEEGDPVGFVQPQD